MASILKDEPFGQRYAYGAADSASEPWSMAAAVTRDVGQFFLGRLGWKPSSAKPEEDESKCEYETCAMMKARLRQQAEARAEIDRDHKRELEALKLKEISSTSPHDAEEVPTGDEAGVPEPPRKLPESGASSSSMSSSTQDEKLKPQSDGKDDLSRVSTASSYTSADIVTSGSGHYEPNNDVILRLETMTSAEVRFLNITLWVWLLVALVFLIYEFVRKLTDENDAVKSFNSPIINSVLGGICLLLVSTVLFCHAFRIYQTRKYKKVWKPRRLKYTICVSIELLAQWINLIFFLLPNFEAFGKRCFRIRSNKRIGYYSLVRWTMWNTLFLMSLIHAHNTNHVSAEKALTSSAGQRSSLQRRKSLQSEKQRSDVAIMDLPFLQAHWPKLLYWLLTEASIILCCIYYTSTVGDQNPNNALQSDAPSGVSCAIRQFDCAISRTSIGLVSIMVFFTLTYFFAYCFYIIRALRQLQSKSNVEYKISNIIVRLQMRLRLPAFGFFILSVLLLWFVKPFSCNSLIDTWFGMLPGQLAATVSVTLLMFVGTPKSCSGQKPILQVWLQEFAWTEAEKPHKEQRRNASLPPDQREEIEKEPMFCVETMMHCLYWSLLVYDFREVDDSKLSLEEACGLFNPPLEEFELFWEKSLDTKMLLAWNKERMVLAFRGTASLANVAADLQAWRSIHLPRRGKWWKRPRVHSGFDKAWRNNGFGRRVVGRIKEIIHSGSIDKSKLKFFVTGHSLGGALATLAAYDMRAIGKKYGSNCKVSCYTFGAPRTGNHAFAQDFESMVPDCWHIINDQDVVARGAKFWVLYKRGGHRVLINPLGDLIVRPNAIEASIRLIPCSGSVQQHLLTSYLRSLLEVMVAQFSTKRIHGGKTGVVQLAKENVALKRLLLEEVGWTYQDLVKLSRWGEYAPKVAAIADLPLTARKTAASKDLQSRRLPGSGEAETTRGGFWCGCCAPTSLKVKAARGDAQTDAEDASVVHGGDVKEAEDAGNDRDDKGDESV